MSNKKILFDFVTTATSFASLQENLVIQDNHGWVAMKGSPFYTPKLKQTTLNTKNECFQLLLTCYCIYCIIDTHILMFLKHYIYQVKNKEWTYICQTNQYMSFKNYFQF